MSTSGRWLGGLAVAAVALATTVAAAQTRPPAEDLLGPCNEISAVGPCANKPLPAEGPTTFPPTLANLEMCRAHFNDMKWADDYKRGEIANRRGASPAEKEALWKEYAAARDDMSARCARSFPALAHGPGVPHPPKPYVVREAGGCDTPFEIDWQAEIMTATIAKLSVDLLTSILSRKPSEPVDGPDLWMLGVRRRILGTVPPGKIFKLKGDPRLYQLMQYPWGDYWLAPAPCA